MRILLVSEDIPYPQMGGLAKHVLTLARALAKAGHEVDLLGGTAHPIEAAGPEAAFGGRFFGELDGHDIGWKEVKLGVFMPPRRTWVARRFAKVILRHAPRYDVVHYHGHAPNVAAFLPADLNFVQTRHDQGSDCLLDTRFRDNAVCTATDASACASCKTAQPNSLQTAVSVMAVQRYRHEVAKGFLRHKTIFVSDILRRNFARSMGGEPHQWGGVVHNFIDPAYIGQALARAADRPASTGTHVFVAGKLYAPKGIEPFLSELAGKLPRTMTVTIAGDGPDAARLREHFENDQIRFAGWCSADATLDMAARADAIAVPSVWEEPCSTSILEGLALGKPLFALARGGTPELSIYSAFPNQLRLHEDMGSLAQDVIDFDLPAAAPMTNMLPCVDHAVGRLLEIYAQPPGSAAQRDDSHTAPYVIKRANSGL